MKLVFLMVGFAALPLSAVVYEPVAALDNPCPRYSLINSVDFHPSQNRFCVTYTQCDRVVLYEVDSAGKLHAVQTLANPKSCLCKPQHAAFSPDGKKLSVANWINQTVAVYKLREEGLFEATPSAVIPPLDQLASCRPHGLCISPCGKF